MTKSYKLPVTKYITYRDEKYSTRNIVDIITPRHGEKWGLHLPWRALNNV